MQAEEVAVDMIHLHKAAPVETEVEVMAPEI
jgi:hypothetical protein